MLEPLGTLKLVAQASLELIVYRPMKSRPPEVSLMLLTDTAVVNDDAVASRFVAVHVSFE